MRIRTNTLQSVRNFFDEELNLFFSSDEIRFYFYRCCEHFLKMSKTQIISTPDCRISESMLLKFTSAVKDLKKQKPIQYILETCYFLDLPLRVTPDTLIPRPETEELTQKIIDENRAFKGKILDICTGSGCIAIALKKRFPNAVVQGLDCSGKAIRIAKENARNNHLNVDFYIADIFDCEDITRELNPPFDIIVSNPPYVLQMEKSQMHANVLDYEPHSALFVDDDKPLKFYTVILDFAKKYLNPNGKLYFEINEKLSTEISDIMQDNGFSDVVASKDFREQMRFVQGRKNHAFAEL